MIKKFMVAAFVASLALLGAGCAPASTPSAEPATPAQPANPSGEPGTKAVPAVPAEPATPSKAGTFELPTIDDTWKTYINKANTFSFRWPTRGRLAPTWEVLMPRTLTDGCYVNSDLDTGGEKSQLTVGDLSFCHTRQGDAGMHQRYFNDYYATTLNGLNIVIAFEKQLTVGDVIGDGKCAGMLVLPGSTENPCLEVNTDAYAAHLDQIVGTFKTLK